MEKTMTEKADPRAKYVKVEVLQAFERYKVGDTPSLAPQKATALEKQGMVKAATKAGEKQNAKATPTA
jgi:hypothetical protein